MAAWNRQRVLGLIWLVGSVLTVLTLVVPYDVDPDTAERLVVVVLAAVTGIAILLGPRLQDGAIHAVLVLGSLTIAWCTSQGLVDTEGVFFLLVITYAFATFPARVALPHLLLAAGLLALVSATAEHAAEPTMSWVMTIGVGGVIAFTLSALAGARDRAREAGRRDRRIAEELQRTLLPEVLPQPPGMALAARYMPAAREADVGGDLYEAVELPGGHVALAVGDVAGKGLGAAAAVGTLRSALRAYALDDGRPGSVLSRLDRLLSRSPDGAGRIVTLLVAVIDLATGDVRWASAGHLPPLVVRAGHGAEALAGEPGPPLGAVASGHPEHFMTLGPGDALLMLTDGLVERRDEPLDVGLARVARALGDGAGAETLVERAVASAPGPLQDDVAVLAAELTALGDEVVVDIPGRPEALAGLRALLRRWLRDRVPAPGVADIVLAVNELAANAIRHGGATEERPFRITATASPEGMLRISVRDVGRWRGSTPDPDRGRGLELARGMVDEVDVHTGPDGTEVTVVHHGRVVAAPRLTRA